MTLIPLTEFFPLRMIILSSFAVRVLCLMLLFTVCHEDTVKGMVGIGFLIVAVSCSKNKKRASC